MQCDPSWTLIGETCLNVGIFFGLTALATTILGWAIGWYGKVYFDNRRLREEKESKQSDVSREAIELAMQWLDPMTLAISTAEDLAFTYLFQRIDRSQFKVRWPKKLPKQLEELEVPSHLRPYLPDGVQQRGTSVIAMFLEFYSRIVRADRSDNDQIFEALHYGQDVRKHIDNLRNDLEAAHRSTMN